MRKPSASLIAAVRKGRLDRRICRQVLHYRGHFRAYDQDGQITDEPDKIVRVELTPRADEH